MQNNGVFIFGNDFLSFGYEKKHVRINKNKTSPPKNLKISIK